MSKSASTIIIVTLMSSGVPILSRYHITESRHLKGQIGRLQSINKTPLPNTPPSNYILQSIDCNLLLLYNAR